MKIHSSTSTGVALAAALATLPARADLPQKPGWPVQLPAGTAGGYVLAPQHNVALVDLDGTPGLEVVASSGDAVVVLSPDGIPVAGWPASVQGTAQAPPSVGDIDGDGALEIVQPGRGLQYSDTSYLHVLSRDGTEKVGWPISYPNLIMNAPALGDMNQDGALDLLVQLGAWPPAGTFLALTGAAQPVGPGWEHPMDSYPLASPAVGDIDGDGAPEVAYLTLGQVTVRRAGGELLAGFPRSASTGREHTGSVVLADLDPARTGLELAWAEMVAGRDSGPAALLAAYADGTLLAGFPVEIAADALEVAPLSIGDVTGDGSLEIVAPANGVGIAVVSVTGQVVATVPVAAQLMTSVQLVDLDGDGALELCADNNTGDDEDGRGYLEGFELDGANAADFPLRPMGITMANGASVGDLDGDGTLELVAVSSELVDPPVSWVNVWSLPAAVSRDNQWATYGGDARHTNNLPSHPPTTQTPPDEETEDGCGCTLAPTERRAPSAWVITWLLLALTRRRCRRQAARPGHPRRRALP